MIKRLIEWCTQSPGIVLALVGASLVYAVISFRSLSVDALPDLSDPQVIVYAKWPRSPEVIQRHVTRPLILALNGIPGVKTVRGITDFGFSYVFVIFDKRTDTSSARTQIREALATAQSTLPAGVQLQLGPDGSSVGWVYPVRPGGSIEAARSCRAPQFSRPCLETGDSISRRGS